MDTLRLCADRLDSIARRIDALTGKQKRLARQKILEHLKNKNEAEMREFEELKRQTHEEYLQRRASFSFFQGK